MADRQLEDLLGRILPEVRQASTDLIVQHFRDVIRDFCQYTRAWQVETPDETIVANQSDYDVVTPGSEAQVVSIEYLEVDEQPSLFKTTEWLTDYVPNWRLRPADDFRFFTHVTGPHIITFPCVPTVAGTASGMKYRAAYKPTENAENVPEELVEEWIEAWSDGTKARLKAMLGEPWANPARSGQLEALYRAARAKARIKVQKSYGNSQDRWVNRGGFA